ncbi:MAG: SBBP repeat-containing protein [Thermoplasmata archaeon]|nr:MAG: SBBP repeat-containing protein [Thermoplasmata archaeon]
MRRKLISIVLCTLLFMTVLIEKVPEKGNAQLIEEWVARYDGPMNKRDSAVALAVDNVGNVYVTGATDWSFNNHSTSDIAIIKYDPSGNELWKVRYDGPGHGKDWPTDISLDPFGNIYVIGNSRTGPTRKDSADYITLKYDSNGNELWVARYDGFVNGDDQPHALAIDILGNVYVTGGSHGSKSSSGWGFDYNYVTIKYDSNGNELWVARYNSIGNKDEIATSITIDPSGNIYITGYSGNRHSEMDYLTVAYDNNGNELWVAVYDGPGNNCDWASDIALDPLGNIYVTGHSRSESDPYPNGNSDYATIKYDPNGNQLWVARYDGLLNEDDGAKAMVIDSSENVIVTGYIQNTLGSKYDFGTIAYDSEGNELWISIYNSPGNGWDSPEAIDVDLSGNIYVVGTSGLWTDENYTTIAYDNSGNQLWLASYDGPGNDRDIGNDIALDIHGNVYITGQSSGGGSDWDSLDWATIKYSHPWVRLRCNVDIDPNTLNLKSKGRWITCYIDLPGYDVNEIDISTIILEDTIPAEWGDIQNDTLMVKFDRSEVEDFIGAPFESIELTVTGELYDGTPFAGSDIIRVIEPGG